MGLIIALEGIDASGKSTQAELLYQYLQQTGRIAAHLRFPRYKQTSFGPLIEAYLNGQFGTLQQVAPQFAALLYANDRLESLPLIRELADNHTVLVIDRYVASNLAHQASRVPIDTRPAFLTWLAALEYDLYHLPHADYTLYLDIPAGVAAQNQAKKQARNYTERAADIHEEDLQYLTTCREVYQGLAINNFGSQWRTIPCLHADGRQASIDEMAEAIRHHVEDMGLNS